MEVFPTPCFLQVGHLDFRTLIKKLNFLCGTVLGFSRVGNYPESMRKKCGGRLPEFSTEDGRIISYSK